MENLESLCEYVLAFCDVVLEAVIIEYQQTCKDNEKQCLLELAVSYLLIVEEHLGTEITQLVETIHQILIQMNYEQESRDRRVFNRGRLKVVIDKDRLLFLKNCGFKINDVATFF